jgi:DAPG hydrolase PhiG domain
VIGEDGWFGRLLHLVQETPEGCVMRSRFWLGELDPIPNPKPTPDMLQQIVPDEFGAGLFAHCCEEMSILLGFRRAGADGGVCVSGRVGQAGGRYGTNL